MSIFEVESSTTLRAGTVEEWQAHRLDGGGFQYAIREPELQKEVTDREESDFPGNWQYNEEGIPIEDVLNGEADLTAPSG